MIHEVASDASVRLGQPCVVGTGLSVGALVALVRIAGGVDQLVASNHGAMLRLSRRGIIGVLEFCAARQCMSDRIVEYCSNCEMLRTAAKTQAGRDIVGRSDTKEVASGMDGEFAQMWLAAKELLPNTAR